MIETFTFTETLSSSSYFLQHLHHPSTRAATATSLSMTGDGVDLSYHNFTSSTLVSVYSEDLCCPIPRRNSIPLISWAFNKKKRDDVLRMSSESTPAIHEDSYDCWETYPELEQIFQNAIHFSSWQSSDRSDSRSGSGSGSISGSGGLSSSSAAVDGPEESEISSDSNELEDEDCLPSDIGKMREIPFGPSSVNSNSSISSSLSSPSFVKTEDDPLPAPRLSRCCEVEDSMESNDATFARQNLTDTFGGGAAAVCGMSPLSSSLTSPSVHRKRPQLGSSTSSLSFIPERSEQSQELITPPMRVPNPLPFNLAFGSKVSHGPEFGLLSVSPPSGEDEDTLLRRARVMSFQKPPSSTIPPTTTTSSEFLTTPKITKIAKPQNFVASLQHIRDGRVCSSHKKRECQELPLPLHHPSLQQPSLNTTMHPPGNSSFTTDMDWNESDVLF